ncbi:DUF2256 domain-containing protein [Pedobacter sp. Leaf176]|uniref:DUF2256 domain-containing protein n=1 Tax=Pedobacter sp. Leaf176 TaxID=1736286 RepID=UPI0035194A8B
MAVFERTMGTRRILSFPGPKLNLRMHPMKSKYELPTKICPVCRLPFSWRKKWKRDWANVVYCSKRCASNK